ncbi:hypothetical protein AAA67_002880 [Salmonella enterica subsp. diarizonae]|nr:hypothetical protein [Salmonella enterica subsp. diarizonae]
MKFKDLPVEVQAIAASLLKDLYIFDQQDVNEERAKNLSKAFVALYQDSSAVNSDITTETGKLIKDSMGVYRAYLGNSQEMEKAPANLRIHKGKELTDNQKMDYKVLATNLRQAAEHLDACAGWAEMSVGQFTKSDPAVRK